MWLKGVYQMDKIVIIPNDPTVQIYVLSPIRDGFLEISEQI